MAQISLYEAKTNLSALVDRAAAGEEIIIAKNGRARARLAPLPSPDTHREIRWGRYDHLGLKLPRNFDAPDPELEALFYGEDKPDGEL